MPIETVAAAAISILVPYLSEAGKGFAKKFGENMAEKAGNLYQAIKSKFTDDVYAEQTLSRVEEKPDSEGRKSTLEQVLIEKLQEDSDFAQRLQQLIEEAKASDARNVFALGDRSVAVGGNLQNSTVVTGDRNTVNKNSTDKAPASGSPGVVNVFLSSTWLDLQPEREAVQTALHRLRETKFIGMEYFGSRDENTRQTSLDEVDRSTLYVGIFGGRYGSGITEAEYRRALEKDLPCLIYVKDEASVQQQWREADPDKQDRLTRLKEELRRHAVSDFKEPEELAAKVTADVHRWLFDQYLTPRLKEAAERGTPTREDQALISKIKDLNSLNEGLLKSLQSAGYVLALGDRSVAIGGNVSGSHITTGNS
ncbi:MAG TPA: DUF4062 domain-containing protein [Pyrinomonadaceae bacterium]|jgi:hypothetical protein